MKVLRIASCLCILGGVGILSGTTDSGTPSEDFVSKRLGSQTRTPLEVIKKPVKKKGQKKRVLKTSFPQPEPVIPEKKSPQSKSSHDGSVEGVAQKRLENQINNILTNSIKIDWRKITENSLEKELEKYSASINQLKALINTLPEDAQEKFKEYTNPIENFLFLYQNKEYHQGEEFPKKLALDLQDKLKTLAQPSASPSATPNVAGTPLSNPVPVEPPSPQPASITPSTLEETSSEPTIPAEPTPAPAPKASGSVEKSDSSDEVSNKAFLALINFEKITEKSNSEELENFYKTALQVHNNNETTSQSNKAPIAEALTRFINGFKITSDLSLQQKMAQELQNKMRGSGLSSRINIAKQLTLSDKVSAELQKINNPNPPELEKLAENAVNIIKPYKKFTNISREQEVSIKIFITTSLASSIINEIKEEERNAYCKIVSSVAINIINDNHARDIKIFEKMAKTVPSLIKIFLKTPLFKYFLDKKIVATIFFLIPIEKKASKKNLPAPTKKYTEEEWLSINPFYEELIKAIEQQINYDELIEEEQKNFQKAVENLSAPLLWRIKQDGNLLIQSSARQTSEAQSMDSTKKNVLALQTLIRNNREILEKRYALLSDDIRSLAHSLLGITKKV